MSHCEPWGSCHSDPTKPTHCSVCGESGCKPIGVAAALREAYEQGRVSWLNEDGSGNEFAIVTAFKAERDALKAQIADYHSGKLKTDREFVDKLDRDEEIDALKEGLRSIVSLAHSWVITPETAPCAPVFDKIRQRARALLGETGEDRG